MARTILSKTCTKSGRTYSGTFSDLVEFFYRDKSQKDGLAPWDKQAEREYNKAYRAGLKAADAPKKMVIEDASALAAFEDAMSGERVTRKRGTRNKTEVATAKAASKAKTQTRAKARAAKKATPAKAAPKKARAAKA